MARSMRSSVLPNPTRPCQRTRPSLASAIRADRASDLGATPSASRPDGDRTSAGKGEDLELPSAVRVSLDPGDAATVLRERVDRAVDLRQRPRLRRLFAGSRRGRTPDHECEPDGDQQGPRHVTIIASAESPFKPAAGNGPSRRPLRPAAAAARGRHRPDQARAGAREEPQRARKANLDSLQASPYRNQSGSASASDTVASTVSAPPSARSSASRSSPRRERRSCST